MISQQLVNGLFLGAVYALFAVGYTLVFGVLDILNLAHAAIFMAAAFAAFSLAAEGVPLPLAFLVAAVVAGVLGIAARPRRVRAAARAQRRDARAADLVDRRRDHHRRRAARHLRRRRTPLHRRRRSTTRRRFTLGP